MECPICGARFEPEDMEAAGMQGTWWEPVTPTMPFDLYLLPCGCYRGPESHQKDRQ